MKKASQFALIFILFSIFSFVHCEEPTDANKDLQKTMDSRMLEGIKEKLKSTTEEWDLIGPMIQQVLSLRSQSRMSAIGGGMMRRGRPRIDESDANRDNQDNNQRRDRFEQMRQQMESNQAPELKALKEALEHEVKSPDAIKSKLDAFRAYKETLAHKLNEAQKQLKSVLTIEQEATLVLSGLID